jgi:acyl-CoA dehydrogenase
MPHHWRQLSRFAAAFALLSDLALLTLGGTLKRREMISARLGDVMSEIYLLGAVLKRWEAEGRQAEDRPLVDYIMIQGIERIGFAFDAVLDNLPARPAAWITRLLAFPLGVPRATPSDRLTSEIASMLMKNSAQRERLTPDLYLGEGHASHPLKDLEHAFALVMKADPIEKRMRDADVDDPEVAWKRGVISVDEREQLREAQAAVGKVIAVDAFPMEEVSPLAAQHRPQPERQSREAAE